MITDITADFSLPAIEELKRRPKWIGYENVRRERPDGKAKSSKVPIDLHNGEFARTNDPETWGSFELAKEAIAKFDLDGYGYVFTSDCDEFGVDLDDCFTVDGVLNHRASQIVSELDSYTEISPSGKGVHILCKGVIPGSLKSNELGIEVYDSGRYFTVSGRHLPGTPVTIETRSEEIKSVFNRFGNSQSEKRAHSTVKKTANSSVDFGVPAIDEVRDALSYIPKQTDYNSGWLRILMGVHSIYPNGTGIRLIEEWSPGYEGEVEEKFRSFSQNGNSSGLITIATVFYIARQNGYQPNRHSNSESSNSTINIRHYHAEDGGILDALEDLSGEDWIYVAGMSLWLEWTGSHWSPDYDQSLQRVIQDLIKKMNSAAREWKADAEITDDKEEQTIAKRFITATKRSRARVNSVMEMAEARRAIEPSMLDQGNLLNLVNGTLDLDDFNLTRHRRDDLLTHCLDFEYHPEAKCPRWELFNREVFVDAITLDHDPELSKLFQEAVGYSLTISTNLETTFWLIGDGSNGKGVSTKIIKKLLGKLAIVTNFHQWGQPGDYELSRLPGIRLVLSTESEKGGQFIESIIKRVVSGEAIPARGIYGYPFEFEPVAKLWWAMNQKPSIKDTSYAIWRRIKLIPFNRTFTDSERDPELINKLIPELPGILNWALDGLKRLRKQGGFTDALASKDAVEEYRIEADPLVGWFNQRVELVAAISTPSSQLFDDFTGWCHENDHDCITSTLFGRRLKEMPGVRSRRSNGVRYNIRVKAVQINED